MQETEASEDELRPEGSEEHIIEWPDVNNKRQVPGSKHNGGAIPKRMPTSNQSTPRAARKGAPKHDWILEQYLCEADTMTQEISKTILTRIGEKSVDGGRKMVAALEIMRTDILEKMTDIDETWVHIENNGESSQATKKVLSRAVKAAAKSTKRAV